MNSRAIDVKEASNILALISFREDGHVESSSSFPNPSDEGFLKNAVREFRSSVSVAEALQKTISLSNLDENSEQEEAQAHVQSPVMVSCDPATILVGEVVENNPRTWMLFAGRPLDFPHEELSRNLIRTIMEVAGCLFPHEHAAPTSSFALWRAIGHLVSSDNFWNLRSRYEYFCEALTSFVRSEHRHSSNTSENTEFDGTLGQFLQTLATEFCDAVREEYNITQLSVCVFSSTGKVVFFERKHPCRRDVLPWYFFSFVNIGWRRIRGGYVEPHDDGTARVWIKRSGWVLVLIFPVSEKMSSLYPVRKLRNRALEVIDAFKSCSNIK